LLAETLARTHVDVVPLSLKVFLAATNRAR
jgi:hypothetical protein